MRSKTSLTPRVVSADGAEPFGRQRQSRRRRWTGAVIWTISASLLGASAASAAAPADSDSPALAARVDNDAKAQQRQAGGAATAAPVPVHGVADDGTVFDGMFELTRFDDRRGVLYAVGRLEGDLGDRAVRKTVRLPVNGATNELPVEGIAQQPHGLMAPQQVPTPGACDILTLNLGPLDLDLLGLRVALDEVNLLIEAIPGAGNLLGNLLCAVAGLLDGGALGGLLSNLLGAITDLLNGLLGL